MKLNVKLLRKVQKAILANPTHFDMDFWVGREIEVKANCKVGTEHKLTVLKEEVKKWKDSEAQAPCGTTACIAGWAVALATKKDMAKLIDKGKGYGIGSYVSLVAPELLASFESEEEEEDKYDVIDGLFATGDWPDEFRLAYKEAEGEEDYPGMAKAASDRNDAFIDQ